MVFTTYEKIIFLLVVPISTFILGPSRAELNQFIPDLKGCELCTNLTYLGKQYLKMNAGLVSLKSISMHR